MALRPVIAWLLTGIVAFFAIPAPAADINGFRVWTDPEKTRAVLDLDARAAKPGKTQFKLAFQCWIEGESRVVRDRKIARECHRFRLATREVRSGSDKDLNLNIDLVGPTEQSPAVKVQAPVGSFVDI